MTTPSGIWTWDLSNSIPYLNFSNQCLIPLNHHGWISFRLWPSNIPKYEGQSVILECETLKFFLWWGEYLIECPQIIKSFFGAYWKIRLFLSKNFDHFEEIVWKINLSDRAFQFTFWSIPQSFYFQNALFKLFPGVRW